VLTEDPRLPEKRNKGERAIETARLCRENGILIFANYMMGIPTETEADLQTTINDEDH